MNRHSDIEEQALRRFVRARAPDFSVEELRELEAWLADEAHRREYGRLQTTWAVLDGMAGRIGSLRPPPARPGIGWAGAMAGVVLAGVVAAWFVVVRPEIPQPQRYETATAEQRVLMLANGTAISLDAESAIDLVDGGTPRVDLLRGDIYIDVGGHGRENLEVRVAGATIRDIGTRFSVAVTDTGASVAVAEGLVELRTRNAYLVVRAGRQAHFERAGGLHEVAVSPDAVAPWHERHWRFETTPLSVLAAEMARQQRIQVDIADPAVAALTVSGSFAFDEPEQVLWAAAQVHGLTLKRSGERHFSLQRDR